MKQSLSWSGLALVGTTACIGAPFVASGTGGGSGGTTASASASVGSSSVATGTTGSSSSGGQPCPVDEPLDGVLCLGATAVPCSYALYTCCEPDTVTCVDNRWSVKQGACAAMTCPMGLPVAGTPCGCTSPSSCEYDALCSTASAAEGATCVSGKWQVASTKCPDPTIPCGSGPACNAQTQVCVRVGAALVATGCATTDCPPGGFDCACARNVCPAGHPICTGTDGPFVNCK